MNERKMKLGTNFHFNHLLFFSSGDAEGLQQPQVSDDLHQPGQLPLPARRQRRAAGTAGGPDVGQSQLDAGLQWPGELGRETSLCAHAVSGQRSESCLHEHVARRSSAGRHHCIGPLLFRSSTRRCTRCCCGSPRRRAS